MGIVAAAAQGAACRDRPGAGELRTTVILAVWLGGRLRLSTSSSRRLCYWGSASSWSCRIGWHKDQRWRSVFGKPSPRLKDQELILRFLALYFDRDGYKRPMKDFLNRFMGRHRRLARVPGDRMRGLFRETIATVDIALGSG